MKFKFIIVSQVNRADLSKSDVKFGVLISNYFATSLK